MNGFAEHSARLVSNMAKNGRLSESKSFARDMNMLIENLQVEMVYGRSKYNRMRLMGHFRI